MATDTNKSATVAVLPVDAIEGRYQFLVPSTLDLPTDYPRATIVVRNISRCEFGFGADLSRRLRRLSQDHGTTVMETLLAGFEIMLARYSNQQHVCGICSIIDPATAEYGHGASWGNWYEIAGDLQGNPPFSVFLESIRKAVRPAPHSRHAHVMQHIGWFQDGDAAAKAESGSCGRPKQQSSEPQDNENGAQGTYEIQLGLTLHAETCNAEITGHFEFNRELFEHATIKRMASCYARLMDSAVSNPECPVYQLEILDDSQRKLILQDWNDVPSLYRLDGDLVSLLEEAVARHGERLAIAGADAEMSYSQLNKQANRLAHLMRGRGVAAGSIVGVCLERSAAMAVSMLAVLKTGAAYLPIDANYPRERILYAIEESHVILVLTQQHLKHLFFCSTAPVLCVDETDLSGFPDRDVAEHPKQTNLAYVIYTSGSTGRPKGVMVNHRSLLNIAQWHNHQFRLGPEDRSSQICSLGFDVCGWEIWPVLLSGASIHIVPEETKLLPEHLRSWLADHQISHTFLPPCLAELLLTGAWPATSALRIMFVGGDRLTRRPPQLTPFRVVNVYGPTEATIWTTFGEVPPLDAHGRLPDIGRPIFNYRTYILDEHLQPVPIGVRGELCIGGEGVAVGYVREPSPDNPKFIADPFSSGRLYRTGDIARYLDDGRIDFIGRADHQVKLRGYRIELGEIKCVLEEQPDISQAAVVIEEDTRGGALVAYVVPRGQGMRNGEELRDALSSKLPYYMVPSRFVQLPSLPLSTSGKLDRKRLPQLQPISTTRAVAAPQTAVERELVRVWSRVLGHSEIGIHDNLFDLGVNSLLAMQAIAESARSNLQFTIRDVFRSQTIAGLAKIARPMQSDHNRGPGDEVEGWPLTPMERWFFEQNFFCPSYWNTSMLFEIDRPVDCKGLQLAIDKLFGLHEGLRAQFRQVGDDWIKYLDDQPDPRCLQAFDLSELTAERQREELRQICGSLQASFTFGSGRLVHFAYFDLGAQGRRLFVVAHHLICDALSIRIILDDLCAMLFPSAVKAQPATTTFREFALRLNGAEAVAQALNECTHWAPHSTGTIPLDFSSRVSTADSMRFAGLEFDAGQSSALVRLAQQRHQCGIDVLLLSSAIYSLMEWQQDYRLAINIVGHGRDPVWPGIDLSRTVGWLSVHNTFYVEFPASITPSEGVAAVAQQLDRVPNEGRGYGILRHIHNRRAPHSSRPVQPEPELFFNYLGDQNVLHSNPVFRRAGEDCGRSMHPSGRWPYWLGMFCALRDGKIQAGWFYSENLHRGTTIEALKERFRNIVAGLLDDGKIDAASRMS